MQISGPSRATNHPIHPATYKLRSTRQTMVTRIADVFHSPGLQAAATHLQRGNTANACRSKVCQRVSLAAQYNNEEVNELFFRALSAQMLHQSQASSQR